MTDQDAKQKELLSELIKIKGGMATKLDIDMLAAQMRSANQTASVAPEEPYYPISIRSDLDRLKIWYRDLNDRVEIISEQALVLTEQAAASERSATQTASAAESVAIAGCLRSCAQTILENGMRSWEASDYLRKYADTVTAQSVPSRTPGPPAKDSSPTNTEERLDHLERSTADMLFQLKEQHEQIQNLERSATQTASVAQLKYGPITEEEEELARLRQQKYGPIYTRRTSVPTQPPVPLEQDSTKTNPEEKL